MKNSIIKIQFDSILQFFFFLCGSFKRSSCGNLKCSLWEMIFKFPSFFELSSNIFAWFDSHQTHQQQSYRHGQRLFGTMALQRKLHTGSDRMMRDSHYPIPLECRLNCATVDGRRGNGGIKRPFKTLCKPSKNLHQRWLRSGQILVQADDLVAHSDKTRSHLIDKWKIFYGISRPSVMSHSHLCTISPSRELRHSYRNDTRVELCCFWWRDLECELPLIEVIRWNLES